jgi:hypothetical protein
LMRFVGIEIEKAQRVTSLAVSSGKMGVWKCHTFLHIYKDLRIIAIDSVVFSHFIAHSSSL